MIAGSALIAIDATLPLSQRILTLLHELGHAHSIETWHEGRLVGGLYGVALGGVFFGESMFHLVPDASQVALVRLCAECRARGIALIDCQMSTPHLRSLGAEEIPREEFLARLARLVPERPEPQHWQGEMPAAALAEEKSGGACA